MTHSVNGHKTATCCATDPALCCGQAIKSPDGSDGQMPSRLQEIQEAACSSSNAKYASAVHDFASPSCNSRFPSFNVSPACAADTVCLATTISPILLHRLLPEDHKLTVSRSAVENMLLQQMSGRYSPALLVLHSIACIRLHTHNIQNKVCYIGCTPFQMRSC